MFVFWEILFENCAGTAIGDSGYVLKVRENRFMKNRLKIYCEEAKNMKIQNTDEEKKLL
jgi:hypothetical protein